MTKFVLISSSYDSPFLARNSVSNDAVASGRGISVEIPTRHIRYHNTQKKERKKKNVRLVLFPSSVCVLRDWISPFPFADEWRWKNGTFIFLYPLPPPPSSKKKRIPLPFPSRDRRRRRRRIPLLKISSSPLSTSSSRRVSLWWEKVSWKSAKKREKKNNKKTKKKRTKMSSFVLQWTTSFRRVSTDDDDDDKVLAAKLFPSLSLLLTLRLDDGVIAGLKAEQINSASWSLAVGINFNVLVVLRPSIVTYTEIRRLLFYES